MTSLSYAQISIVQNEINAFQSAYAALQTAISSTVATGTVVYDDANFATLYASTEAAYKSWLVSTNSAIQTFLASLTQPPSLSQ